ncbi:hypothetical protein PO909_016912 [Leuciscus waleckii]
MPDQISVSEFLSETTEDYNSPTTSSFTTRLQSCRNTVGVLEEVRNYEVPLGTLFRITMHIHVLFLSHTHMKPNSFT